MEDMKDPPLKIDKGIGSKQSVCKVPNKPEKKGIQASVREQFIDKGLRLTKSKGGEQADCFERWGGADMQKKIKIEKAKSLARNAARGSRTGREEQGEVEQR